MITVTTFRWVPPVAQGLVRDLRVRWALEEAGLPYRTRLIDFDERNTADYRARQPFGQVPVFEENGLTLFESGAILLHVGERSETLLPTGAGERARATAWVFAALNSVETFVQPLAEIDLFHAEEDWARQRRPQAEQSIRHRLGEVATWLDGRDYLEDRFSVGDIVMTHVLRCLRHTDLVEAEPTLRAYQSRCEARPAFQRALADHMAVFAA